MPERNSRTVYSTDPNFKLCPRCGNYPCRCRKPKSLPAGDQTASILRERKGRGGKTVTVVRGLVLAPDDLKALAKQLKLACGTGGTIKEETIEIQGDHREKVAETLRAIGYKTKMVGG
ncbi:MAG: translation initiation factor [Omnitrophica WOR_2 bacterium]